jgi:DNA mismatch repair protein MutS
MDKLTPMMGQYWRVKKKYPECLVLFRMGDFYETFYDDAVKASQILGIALTSRDQGKAQKVPLAGIPYRALDRYVATLIRAGLKVAVCDQLEDAQFAKGIVKRDVTEVITAGTLLSPSLLEDKKNNYIVSLVSEGERVGLAAADLSTGEFLVSEFAPEEIEQELSRFDPGEILLPEGVDLPLRGATQVTRQSGYHFSWDFAHSRLCEHFRVASLQGFGCEEMTLGVGACGALLSYLEENQKTTLSHLRPPRPYLRSDFLYLDPLAQANLELVRRIRSDETQGTLLWVLDKTLTPIGGRLLRRWVLAPLKRVQGIQERQAIVKALVESGSCRMNLREVLKEVPDLERLSARIACGRCSPRDIAALARALGAVPRLRSIIETSEDNPLSALSPRLGEFETLVRRVEQTLSDELPLSLSEGGVIRSGFDPRLDELRELAHHSRGWIAKLQTRERERTGIQSLKVGYNSVFGYYIEVTKPNLRLVPPEYQRKQTIANGERFVTPELKEYEAKILGAEEKARRLEEEIYAALRQEMIPQLSRVQETASCLAEIDVLATLAQVAQENGYVCPELDDSEELKIVAGRHPVVEQLLPPGSFVPNDLMMDAETKTILIITGPNMAGKSTFLRQAALLVIMAQIGSFIPAERARMGIIDRIFTRIGAADDLAAGRSTFLVEMGETANILHNATTKSLILLDEIGRGTSTFDGLSIAWAVVEYLHGNPRIRSKTLFATHYHELTELASVLPRVKNYNVAVKEFGDQIVFLRKVVEGGSDRSYGIQVGRLAGLPSPVVVRAAQILANLEAHELTPDRLPRTRDGEESAAAESGQLRLFIPYDHPLVDELRRLDVTGMTPLEALTWLTQRKDELKRGEKDA